MGKSSVHFIMQQQISIFWFRRDLRLDDNAGLYHALRSGHAVLPIFIFDTNILNGLENKTDRRVQYIHKSISDIQEKLVRFGSGICVLNTTPIEGFKELTNEYNIVSVYTNHDYEPYAKTRDAEIRTFLEEKNISFYTYKDQVIFEKNEVLKDNNTPYTIFTPYSKRWREKLNDFYLQPYPTRKYFNSFLKQYSTPIPSMADIGFNSLFTEHMSVALNETLVRNYDKTRDYPALDGTTKMSVRLRFGTISIRSLAAEAKKLNDTLLNELIWRDFYQMILWHFPHVVNGSFKKEYDQIKWRNNEKEFELWCTGKTGYPIVDAGMRQLNQTGYMHNRVRMVTASFLTKHLLIDWRWGEAYFAENLLDYDLAANNGGWQWAVGSGCDAAPYFRIFNPYLQTKKFDPDLEYIRQWLPEYDTPAYPQPIVEHTVARERCLDVYKKALRK